MRNQVRYSTFGARVKDRPWVDCEYAAPEGEVLAINYGDGRREWVPLHVIRGPIEYRRKPLDNQEVDRG